MHTDQTIFALATPLGGAIAIIRISGNATRDILNTIFSGKVEHSRLCFGRIHDSNIILDEAMAVFFHAPQSYTGEDMAELHIHASSAVANSVMELLRKNGAVPAEAGEFSKRAFLNGKMRLSQAEAVMDLINSTADRSAKAAIMQLSGKLSQKIEEIEAILIAALALIDATIDYPDEMEDAIYTTVPAELERAHDMLFNLYTEGMRAHKIRDGATVAITGKPNVGKSSLLNALISQEKAIVTAVAGTTRDVIDAEAVFCGLPVHLFDTAGLHDTADTVERLGIERTRDVMQNADIIYTVLDNSEPFTAEDAALIAELNPKLHIVVLSKSDVGMLHSAEEFGVPVVEISAKTGMGLAKLQQCTAERIAPETESGIITNLRHVHALEEADHAVLDALSAIEVDCMATDIQTALHSIAQITGRAVDEAVITHIFERFCVGK